MVHDVSRAIMTPAVQEEMAQIESLCEQQQWHQLVQAWLQQLQWAVPHHRRDLWPCAPHQPQQFRLPEARQALG